MHAGDLSPTESYTLLQEKTEACLIDVRTQAEWSFVGLPDLSSLGKQPILLEWQTYPTMAVNAAFAQQLSAQVGLEAPMVFLCRSGARSAAAAATLTQMGAKHAYNIAGGFEGDRDAAGHRGVTNGWKAEGLPWQQG